MKPILNMIPNKQHINQQEQYEVSLNIACLPYKDNFIVWNPFYNIPYLFTKDMFDSLEELRKSDKIDKNILIQLPYEFIENGIFEVSDCRYSVEEKLEKNFPSNHSTELCIEFYPSYACNLACPYCYTLNASFNNSSSQEKWDTLKTVQTVENLRIYLERCGKDINRISVTLLGGEPFLPVNWREGIHFLRVLQTHSTASCMKHSVFTNGTLISSKKLREFKNEGGVSVQVTLDGNQKHHNIQRPFKNGKPSFPYVIRGIQLIKDEELDLVLRINFSDMTEKDFFQFRDLLEKEGILDYPKLSIYPTPIVEWKPVSNQKSCISDSVSLIGIEKYCQFLNVFKDFYQDIYRHMPINLHQNRSCCRASEISTIDILPNGVMTPCGGGVEKFDALVIGNARSGKLHEERINKLLSFNITSLKRCRDCEFILTCNRCPAQFLYDGISPENACHGKSKALKDFTMYVEYLHLMQPRLGD